MAQTEPTIDYALLDEIKEPRSRGEKFKTWFRQSHDASETWRRRAIESYKFAGGDQWSEQDLARLAEQRRPALVINKVLAPILFLAGVQRQQRTEAKLLPFESGDARAAELMQALLKWVGSRSKEAAVDSKVFLDKIITGLGFWKLGLDYSDNPEGELQWERLSPLAVYPDPNWLDQGWDKAEYVIQAVWMGLEEAMDRWPSHRHEIRRRFGEWLGGESQVGGHANLAVAAEFTGDTLADRRLFWDPETQRARVLEIWYVKRHTITIAIDTANGQVVSAEPDVVRQLREAQREVKEIRGALRFVRRPVKRVWVAHQFNDILLDDEPSPHEGRRLQRFPIFPALAYYFWRHPFGLTEVMKDPQREKNKRRSTIVEMVMRMPHSGFLNQREGGAKTEDIEKFATGNGAVVNYDQVPPTKIPPPDLPQALIYLDRASDEEVRAVVNINNELLGNTTQRTVSGRAITARQKSGLVVQEPLMESFEQEKEEAVRFMLALIQQNMPIAKALRILGTIAVRDDASETAQMMAAIPDPELFMVLSEAFEAEYDIVIKHIPADASLKAQQWQILLELAQTFPGEIPPDLLVEAAKDAGLFTEKQAARVAAYVKQKEAMQEATAATALQTGAVPPSEAIQ